MIIHDIPKLAWSKVGADLFQIEGNHYIVLVDYFSNYIDVSPLPDLSSKTTIKIIRTAISRFGIIDALISDNGLQFSREEFKTFTRDDMINHVTSSPRHPKSNGLAENVVKTAKRMIKKCIITGDDVNLAVLELNSTHRDDDVGSPMQQMFSRRVQTRLPTTEALLKPTHREGEEVEKKLMQYRLKEKEYYDRGTRPRAEIKPGDAIRIQTDKGFQPAEFVGRYTPFIHR